MVTAGVDVDLYDGNAVLEHGGKIFGGPDGVDPVAPSRAGNECWRGITRDSRCSPFGEKGRAWVDQPGEIRPRRHLCQRVPGDVIARVKFGPLERGRRRQFGTRRESHDAYLLRIEIPVPRVCTDQLDRLEGVIDPVHLRFVTVAPEPVPQYYGAYAIAGEVGYLVRSLGDIEALVAPAGGQDDDRARVESRVARMKLNGRVVDVHNGANLPRAAHGVFFGFVHLLTV